MDGLINGVYYVGALIGRGAFGEIYLGQDVQKKTYVAIKKELQDCKSPQLAYEAKVYKCLEGGMGIPKVYLQTEAPPYNVMVMDLLGPSLEDMFNYCGRIFSTKTVLMLGIELLTRLEFIHHRNFIHRDIKPDNFGVGLGKRANVIYVMDFGLSKRYRNPQTKQHIPFRENKNLTGTPRYASLNNHLGIEQSRRDDLESLGFVLLYFLRGKLPWQGLMGNAKKQKYEKIMQCKMDITFEQLCEGYPTQFLDYMNYCRNLRFDEVPDYRKLRRFFKTALEERYMKNDGVYDWMDSTLRHYPDKLPKHARNSQGRIVQDLLYPAPSEFREMYKEEAYRLKSQQMTTSHGMPMNVVMQSKMETKGMERETDRYPSRYAIMSSENDRHAGGYGMIGREKDTSLRYDGGNRADMNNRGMMMSRMNITRAPIYSVPETDNYITSGLKPIGRQGERRDIQRSPIRPVYDDRYMSNGEFINEKPPM